VNLPAETSPMREPRPKRARFRPVESDLWSDRRRQPECPTGPAQDAGPETALKAVTSAPHRASPHAPPRAGGRAFTLVELLVSIAVLSIFVLVLSTLSEGTFRLWRGTASSVQMFDGARAAFDIMGKRLGQATLNTYLDYYDASWKRRVPGNSSFVPAEYARASDLHFLSGRNALVLGNATAHPAHGVFFFAPLGFTDNSAAYRDLPNLLNPTAYFVEFGDDAGTQPGFLQGKLPSRNRYRLVEVVQPSQNFTAYPKFTDGDDPSNDRDWITGTGGLAAATGAKHYLAENVIALVLRPELSERDALAISPGSKPWNPILASNGNYTYDSRASVAPTANAITARQFAQLPPLLRVVMVAVDETSAARVANGSTPPAVFDTSTLFVDPDQLDADLALLEQRLASNRIRYRVFNTVLPLRGAKWNR